jgi:glutaminyl-peptide cyclotransferase
VRLLIIALAAQFVLCGALIYFAVAGWPFLDPPAEAQDARRAPPASADRFDVGRAWSDIRLQLAAGQRPAGSTALRRLAPVLRAKLPGGRAEPVPGGLQNLVGVLPGRRPAIVIGAHYDTEARPVGFVGANDSAAGTAAVLELARALARHRRPGGRELRFVLFDGEEEPPGSTDFARDALRGSKAYVRAHRGEVSEMILLDYVANRGLTIERELGSDPRGWARLRAAARRVGVGAVFPARDRGEEIFDDHTAFAAAGIPAIDLIDFDYRHRDTVRDTIDKLDRRSLDAVGEAVVELVRRR